MPATRNQDWIATSRISSPGTATVAAWQACTKRPRPISARVAQNSPRAGPVGSADPGPAGQALQPLEDGGLALAPGACGQAPAGVTGDLARSAHLQQGQAGHRARGGDDPEADDDGDLVPGLPARVEDAAVAAAARGAPGRR